MIRNSYKEHIDKMRWNDRLALGITKYVGTMWTAYLFAVIAVVSLPAALASHDPIIIVAWIAQTFLQLVLLPIIIVGQNLQNKHTEIQSDADYETNVEAKKEIEELARSLSRLETEKLDKIIEWIGVLLRSEIARRAREEKNGEGPKRRLS
jgi:uncharacterized membrane protein